MIEWTHENEAAFVEYLKKEGYETFRLRIEKMINECTEDLIQTRDLNNIPKVHVLTTLLKICDNARS